jgi:hypothetical protein
MTPFPADINRDDFVMDVDWRNTSHLATIHEAEGVLEIVPRSLPSKSLWIMNAVYIIGAVTCAFVILPQVEIASHWAFGLLAAATLVTCGATTGTIAWSYLHEQSKGAWLIYDMPRGVIKLPRHQIELSRNDFVHLEEVTTRSLRNLSWHLLSELNVVAIVESRRLRWNLLKSDTDAGAYSHLLIPIRRRTDLPIVRVRGNRFDWQVRRSCFDPIQKT